MSDSGKKTRATKPRAKTKAPVKKAAATDTSAEDRYTGRDRVFDFADAVQEQRAADATGPERKWETWVTFALAGETYAFAVETVKEIVRVGTITRVPHAPYPVRGIINLRGRVVPVVDLRVRIGLPRIDITQRSRVLIAAARERVLGLLVDAVEQVVRVDRNELAPAPDDVMTEQSEYILGVCQHDESLFILLDSERVLVIPDGLQPERSKGEAA